MWQALYEELESKGLTVIAVALDTPEAARKWIEQANPDYPAPIDREHRVAELYNLVNVPQAVWIDEEGRIVRPPESAGTYEAFRYRDRETGVTPEDEAAKKEAARALYLDAIRDWVAKGTESRFVMGTAEVRRHLSRPSDETALAHVHFRLGEFLLRQGRTEEAERQMAEASRLHPDSWAIWRQTAGRNEQGFAADESFWERVAALGEKRYHLRIPMTGMP